MTPSRKKRNCTWLMMSLFVLLMLSPIMEARGTSGRIVLSGLTTFVLLSGIGVVSDSRRHLWWAIALMLPPLLVLWISHALELTEHRLWLEPSFYMLPIYLFLCWLITKHIFSGGHMSVDQLHGAISLYLLLGQIWAHGYLLLERLVPNSFNYPGDHIVGYGRWLTEFTYFSYVTLTTLGYGEITPVTSMARTLCILEAIAGVLFMGAFVARIAGNLGHFNPEQTEDA